MSTALRWVAAWFILSAFAVMAYSLLRVRARLDHVLLANSILKREVSADPRHATCRALQDFLAAQVVAHQGYIDHLEGRDPDAELRAMTEGGGS